MFVFRCRRERCLPLPTVWTLPSWSYSWSAHHNQSELGTKKNKTKTQQVGFELLSVYEKKKKKEKKKRKVNCCPVFLGTLRVITVWPLVITTQSRPSKDALSDFTQQQNPKVVFYSVGFYSDLHAVRTANHFTRVLSRCCYDDCPDKQHESSFWVSSQSRKHFIVDFAFKRRAALFFFFLFFFFFFHWWWQQEMIVIGGQSVLCVWPWNQIKNVCQKKKKTLLQLNQACVPKALSSHSLDEQIQSEHI